MGERAAAFTFEESLLICFCMAFLFESAPVLCAPCDGVTLSYMCTALLAALCVIKWLRSGWVTVNWATWGQDCQSVTAGRRHIT